MDLSGLELEIGQARDRAFRLRSALGALNKGARDFDFTYVLVDCPPSLNLLTVNAMAAADSILCRCNASSSRSKACRNC